MRIRIIRGIYGHRENGRIVEKSPKQDAFDVEREEGMRLISMGIAERTGEGKEDAMQPEDDGGTPEENAGNALREDEDFPEPLEEMGLAELQKIAGEMGLKKNGSKKELADRIREHLEAEEEEDGEGEMPILHPAGVE